MHGVDVMQETLFTMKQLDEFVPKQHPLRAVRALFGQTFVATRVPPQTALVDEAIAYIKPVRAPSNYMPCKAPATQANNVGP